MTLEVQRLRADFSFAHQEQDPGPEQHREETAHRTLHEDAHRGPRAEVEEFIHRRLANRDEWIERAGTVQTEYEDIDEEDTEQGEPSKHIKRFDPCAFLYW